MKRLFLFILLPGLLTCSAKDAPRTNQTIILLHGMGRTQVSLLILQKRFEKQGYTVLNFPYLEIGSSFQELTEKFRLYVQTEVKTKEYYFVAHSLGNIIIRNGFKKGYRPGLKGIVMLAPPNQPAHLAKILKDFPLFKWRTGESGQILSQKKFYESLPVPGVPFGIIAGNKGHNLTFNEPNDGVVVVSSTKLRGSSDWIVLNHSHTFIMNAEDTFAACLHFIKKGKFPLDKTI